MRNHRIIYVIVLCCLLLLNCAICGFTALPPSYRFFISRWSGSPDWSSNGKRIAFTCHYPTLSQVLKDVMHDPVEGNELFHWGYLHQATEICIVNVDGSNFARLTHNQVSDGHPVWSPDGRLVAYLSGSGSGIYLMDDHGKQAEGLAKNLDVLSLAWSPDGTRILFTAIDPIQPEQGRNLYIVTVEDGTIATLTTFLGDEMEARWSPDGTQLAFVWFPEGFRWLASEKAVIWISDGRENTRKLVEGFARIGDLSWSPDSTRLGFWAFQSPDCVYECTEAYVIDVTDPIPKCVTERYDMDMLFQTAWSPDGIRIAFVANGPQGTGLYTASPNGESLSWVAPVGPGDYSLAWSPTGEFISFVRGIEGEKSRIWLVQVADGTLQELSVP